MDKIKFPKKTRIITTEQLGMDDYPGIQFEVWDDPNEHVVVDLTKVMLREKDELTEEIVDKYFEAVTDYIVDCNLEGLSFNTVEETLESFDHRSLSWGFMYEFMVLAITELLSESANLKKVFKAQSETQNSGSAKEKKEIK